MTRTLNPQIFGNVERPTIPVDASQMTNKKMRDLEAQIEILQQKFDRLVQVQDQKHQQLQAGQKNLGEQIRQVAENFSNQQAAIQSKFNENRKNEAKTQDLFDRHNQLVHNFELRINQIQKVTTEQEMKLMTYQATYDEVLREIRGLRHR